MLRETREKEAGIFDAHMLVLEDRALIEDVKKEIQESGENVEKCVHRVTEKYLKFFDQLEDKYLRERAVDLRDISPTTSDVCLAQLLRVLLFRRTKSLGI